MIFRTNVLNIWSATLRRRLLVAVTAPLEVVVRPLFGKNSCRSLPVAVTAPLEATVRPLFGQISSEKLAPNRRRSQKGIKRL